MKIRIIQAGFESFTDWVGDVKFVDGVSVDEVSEQQAQFVRALFVTATLDQEGDGYAITDNEAAKTDEEVTA